jgi:MEMO1 family protein
MNDFLQSRPRLRSLEAFPLEEDNQTVYGLRDRTGLVEQMLVVPAPAFFIISHFDGSHTLEEVGKAFSERFGSDIEEQDFREILDTLDAHLLLDSDHFQQWCEAEKSKYLSAPNRHCASAGGAYSDDPEKLRTDLDGILQRASAVQNGLGQPRGVVVPHIDYKRGTDCYAAVYSALKTVKPASTYVILGSNHYGGDSFYCATRKNFATPLGTVEVDQERLERLSTASREDMFAYECDHAREHSVELQAVWLAHLFGAENIKIVPIICGGFELMHYNGETPDKSEIVQAMVGTLRELLDESPGEVCLMAAADMSHIGQFFGDEEDLAEPWLKQIEQNDREILREAQSGSPASFFDRLYSDHNASRVCSASNLYTLKAVCDVPGQLLNYHQAVEREAECAVTCAALWYE